MLVKQTCKYICMTWILIRMSNFSGNLYLLVKYYSIYLALDEYSISVDLTIFIDQSNSVLHLACNGIFYAIWDICISCRMNGFFLYS